MSIDVTNVLDTLFTELKDHGKWLELRKSRLAHRTSLLVSAIMRLRLSHREVTAVNITQLWISITTELLKEGLEEDERRSLEHMLAANKGLLTTVLRFNKKTDREFMLNHSTLNDHAKTLYREGGLTYEVLVRDNPYALMQPFV